MIMQIMKMISRLTEPEKRRQAENRVSPAFRLCVAILTILLCALSKNAVFTGSVIVVLLLRVAFLAPREIANVLGKTVLPVLFSALILLPAALLGQPGTLLTVTMKVFESVLLLALLNHSVSWKDMSEAMGEMHFPQILIMTLDTMIRFLVILGRFMGRVLEAVGLRKVGKDDWKHAGTGGILGVTYLKAQQMEVQTEEAMAYRCFEGTYRSYRKRKFGRRDALYLLLVPAIAAWFVYTQALM